MIIKLVFQLIKLQGWHALKLGRQNLGILLVASTFFGLLYLLSLHLLFPNASAYVAKQIVMVEETGSGRGTFYGALIHLGFALSHGGGYFSHMSHILDKSVPLRVFHHRVRSPICLALALQVECLAVILFVDLLLLPCLWSPFWQNMEQAPFGRLIAFKFLIIGVVLTLVTAGLALRHWFASRGGRIWVLWVAVLFYYVLVFLLGFEAFQSFQSPSKDQLFVRFLRLIQHFMTDDHFFARVGVVATVWCLLLPLATTRLQGVIRRYGI